MTDEEYGTTRIWKKTLKKLRLLAALLDMSIVATIDHLVDEKLKELRETKGE